MAEATASRSIRIRRFLTLSPRLGKSMSRSSTLAWGGRNGRHALTDGIRSPRAVEPAARPHAPWGSRPRSRLREKSRAEADQNHRLGAGIRSTSAIVRPESRNTAPGVQRGSGGAQRTFAAPCLRTWRTDGLGARDRPCGEHPAGDFHPPSPNRGHGTVSEWNPAAVRFARSEVVAAGGSTTASVSWHSALPRTTCGDGGLAGPCPLAAPDESADAARVGAAAGREG